VIGTDHVGYGSFDLWPLRQAPVLQSLQTSLQNAGFLGTGKTRLTVALNQLLVMPFKDPSLAFDALKEGDLGPNFICLRMNIDAAMLVDRQEWGPMPSMQTPGILDWRLSPGSFSMSGVLLIGEEGCETLLPSNLATRMVRFRQIIRTQSKAAIHPSAPQEAQREPMLGPNKHSQLSDIGLSGEAVLGYIVQYNSEWFPLGHSLGQIAYSLPLAPGEKMSIAIVDWTRRDAAKRNEQTTEKEDLQHAALRDRTLTEAVHMVVTESQSGSSFMAGGALSAGAGIPIGAVSLGIGGAFGVGGASANSQGMRDVVGNTTQSISDAFHQSSSALRELNSTVVIQSDQAESAEAKTRVIANHNHSHALTILYYEVLQHHRVLTRPASIRPVVFLKYKTDDFGLDTILRYQFDITAALLDPTLKDCMAVVAKRDLLNLNFEREKTKREKLGDPLEDVLLGSMTITYNTGQNDPAPCDINVSIVPKDGGPPIDCELDDKNIAVVVNVAGGTVINYLNQNQIKPGQEFIYNVHPTQPVRLNNIGFIQIRTAPPGHVTTPPGVNLDWDLTHLRVITQISSDKWVMIEDPNPGTILFDTTKRFAVNSFKPPVTSVDDLLTNEELYCLDRLVKHMNNHKGYYWRRVWMAEDSADRAIRLEGAQIGGHLLSDILENNLLDFVGDYAVMPIVPGADSVLAEPFDVKDLAKRPVYTEFIEQILTTPERGVFAEAKLGHCNASEVIDTNRFWDWQLSPIPEDAPSIAAVSTDSRFQDPTKGLAATPFPSSIVNIVNPQSLPDPTGLTAASGLLSSLGPFRDMSGIQQLAQFLQTLSNNATQLASQGLKNAGAKAPTGGQSTAPSTPEASATSPSTPGKGGDTPSPSTPTSNLGGGSTPPPTPTPQPAPVASPDPTPKPIAPPAPQRSPALSPKTRLLVFTFSFDINDVMMGRWKVELISGLEIRTESRVINTVASVAGVDVGNRMEIYIENTFGGTNDVSVHINGTIVGLPQALSTGTRKYEVKTWSEPRDFTADITRSDFDKAHTIRVVQATEEVHYTISRTIQGTKATTKTNTTAAGLELGVEDSMEAGVNVNIPEVAGAAAKEAIKINAKGTFNTSVSNQTLDQIADGWVESADFKGYMVKPSAPLITPLK
jgi:hypothetical protein